MLHLAARDADQARVRIRRRDTVWTITMPIDGATTAYRLLGLMLSGAAELVQWEIFSAVRVDDLYPDHTGIRLAAGDGLAGDV